MMSREAKRKNINRGYMKLTVWQDAKECFKMTCVSFRNFSFELKKVASQQIASVDSIHRNIAEGYCRRSLGEYLQFLNVALASAGESVSAIHVYRDAELISDAHFEELDPLAYKIKNGMKRLIECLQQKQLDGTWQDNFVVRESNAAYDADPSSEPHHSSIPPLQHSRTPAFHPSIIPIFQKVNKQQKEQNMTKIQILGTGCPKCKMLRENAEAAVKALGIEAEVEKVEKITDIMAFGVMTTPALAVDGKVKSAGKVLSPEQVAELIKS